MRLKNTRGLNHPATWIDPGRVSVPSRIIVRPPRLPQGRHDYAGLDTPRGFQSGGGGVLVSRKRADKVQPNNYWSGTEYAPNTNNAWDFNFNNGNQNANNKNNNLYALAVRPGE